MELRTVLALIIGVVLFIFALIFYILFSMQV